MSDEPPCSSANKNNSTLHTDKRKRGSKESCPGHDWDTTISQSLFSCFFTSRSLPRPLHIFSSISFHFSHRRKCTDKTQWPGWCCWAEPALPAFYFWLDPFKLVDASVSLIYTYLLNSIWQKTRHLFLPLSHRSAEGLMQAEPQCLLNGRKYDGNRCESLLLEKQKRKRRNICSENFSDLCKTSLQTQMRTVMLHTGWIQCPLLVQAFCLEWRAAHLEVEQTSCFETQSNTRKQCQAAKTNSAWKWNSWENWSEQDVISQQCAITAPAAKPLIQ